MVLNPAIARSGRSNEKFANEFLVMSRCKTPKQAVRALAVAVLMCATAACTSQLSDLSEPADVARSTAQPSYPAVHDMPTPRDTSPMSAEERRRIADELAAARERQEAETTGTVPPRTPQSPGR
jgi:hypothetical protein